MRGLFLETIRPRFLENVNDRERAAIVDLHTQLEDIERLTAMYYAFPPLKRFWLNLRFNARAKLTRARVVYVTTLEKLIIDIALLGPTEHLPRFMQPLVALGIEKE